MPGMDRFEAMRVFATVAEHKSFAAAARKLALSAPAVTRAIAALEQHLGVALLRRTTRSVQVTEAGAQFLADSRRLLTEVDEAEQAARGAHARAVGHLTITAPLMLGKMHVAPIVLEFLDSYPEVTVRALFADHVVDMMEEGVDVAVRIGRLESSSLSALRVGTLRQVLCAAPQYLRARGTPSSPAELCSHALIGFVGVSPHRRWSFMANGKAEPFEPTFRLSVNTGDFAVQAALAGHGIVRMLSYQVAEHLKSGALVRVLVKHEPEPLPVHVLHTDGRRTPARVRAFVDLAVRRLKALALK
jgi:DNA-binding transcriptional LysR family regulator